MQQEGIHGQQSELDRNAETSSLYSQDSNDTAVFLGKREGVSLLVPLSLEAARMTGLPRVDHMSQTPVRTVISADSRLGTSTHEVTTPLIHFPIAPQATSRLTPTTLTRQVIGGAGGQLHAEDVYQARLVRNISADLLEAFSADVWTFEAEDSMISELQPEPLRLSRRESQLTQDQIQECSRMLRGLKDGIPEVEDEDESEKELGNAKIQQTLNALDSSNVKRCASLTEESFGAGTRGRGGRLVNFREQSRNFTDSIYRKGNTGEQPFESSQITPENSQKTLLEGDQSFYIATEGPSGFTPRHPKKDEALRPIPCSPIMMDFGKPEISEKEVSETIRATADRLRNGRRFGIVQSKEESPLVSGCQSQGDQRMLSTTPQGMRSFTLWRNGHAFHVNEDAIAHDYADGETTTEAAHDDETITTRDFFQLSDVKTNRPKHRPIPVDAHRFSSQRFDPDSRIITQFAQTKTPSPTERRESTALRTPTSALSNLFRKRRRSEHVPTPRTPRTPATPTTHWRPFDDPQQPPPCSSVWTSGRREDKREKKERAAYFKEKVDRESMMDKLVATEARSRSSLRNKRSKEDMRRRNTTLEHRQSIDSLMGWKSFIDDSPEQPPVSSPLPPVPPLPSASKLTNLAATTRDFSVPTPSGAGFRSKKPQGLKVETNKLRKVSREGLHSARKTTSSGGLRTAFRLEGRRLSFGKGAGDRRADEVVRRG